MTLIPGLIEGVARRIAEVSAGILHILVEKEPVNVGRDVVVMAGIFRGRADGVGLMPAPKPAPQIPQQFLRALGVERGAIDREQHQEVLNRGACLEREGAVHVGFTGTQFRIQEQRRL
jgi:hypothetical protein